MNYTIEVFYTNGQTTRRYNAETLTKAWAIVDRQKGERFVRKIELTVMLETWMVHKG